MTKPTTLIEVARLAGVSTATVNRVLKGVGYVSADTRTRIEAAIKKTRYRPNALARELRNQRSMTIGHVVSAITANPFFANVARGADDEALEKGFRDFSCSITMAASSASARGSSASSSAASTPSCLRSRYPATTC